MQTVNTCNSHALLDQQSKKNDNKNEKSKMKIQHTKLQSNSIQSLNSLTFQHNLYTYVLHSFVSIQMFYNYVEYLFLFRKALLKKATEVCVEVVAGLARQTMVFICVPL